MLTQPADVIEGIGVPPHPLRKAFEAAQCFHAVHVLAGAAHERVHSIRVRPVGLHREGAEAALFDEAFGNLRALPIELVGAVAGFAEQDKAGVTDALQL